MMTRRFSPIYTGSSWQDAFRLRDRETQELVDLTPYTIEIELYKPRDRYATLSLTTADGTVTLFDDHTAVAAFTGDQTDNLDTGNYDIRARVSISDEVTPLFTGTVTVLRG